MTRQIPVYSRKQIVGYALVDDADYEELAPHRWYLLKNRDGGKTYAARGEKSPDGGSRHLSMHRQILRGISAPAIDHRNGDGFDNRRANLRPCSVGENTRNRGKPACGRASQFKGVFPHKNCWQAYINVGGRRTYLGYFATEIEAAERYDAAAHELHGAFASFNLRSPFFESEHNVKSPEA